MASHVDAPLREQSSRTIEHKPRSRACDLCKRRKVRCEGGNPCLNCSRNRSACRYTSTHGRLAQLERRLQQLQEHQLVLEHTWKHYVPETELATAIEEIKSRGIYHDSSSVSISNTMPDVVEDARAGPFLDRNEPHCMPTEDDPSPADSEYEQADTLDWDESDTAACATDAFGSLSTNWKGLGYMGHTTGNTLLRKLQSLSVLYLSALGGPISQQPREPLLPASDLKSSRLARQCIDWYFQYYHGAYPILHEGHFRAQLMGAIPKPKDGSWPILLNTILALGASSGPACHDNAHVYFYREASRHFSWDLLQKGTLHLVQAFGLLANYLQMLNRPNSAFTVLGIAMNMAQGIGLHRHFRGLSTTPFTTAMRRRVWWTLFVHDAGVRLTFGRPTLSLRGVNTKRPLNLDDEDLTLDMDELPSPRDALTITSSLIWQIELAQISNSANANLSAKHVPALSTMLPIADEIVQWSASLPDYVNPEHDDPTSDAYLLPKMVLRWRPQHLRIVIYRPYLLLQIKRRESLDFTPVSAPTSLCFQAADELISSICSVWEKTSNHNGALAWNACYFLITAGFVHVSCLLYEPHNALARGWREQIENCTTILQSVGALQPTALRAVQILSRIIDLIPCSPNTDFFEMNEPAQLAITEMWNLSWTDAMLPQAPLPEDWFADMDPASSI